VIALEEQEQPGDPAVAVAKRVNSKKVEFESRKGDKERSRLEAGWSLAQNRGREVLKE